jgi:uncharacterized membrane protein
MLAESGRVEAFSDGVLAIAITLLVLDLHMGDHPGHVGHDLLTQWPTYLAYVASFIYIGVVWVNHHSLFTRIARVDAGLLWCNMALLLAASVLPFPTAELAFAMQHGTHGDKISALLLYAEVSAAMAATWLAMFVYLHRHPGLLRPGVTVACCGPALPSPAAARRYRRLLPGRAAPGRGRDLRRLRSGARRAGGPGGGAGLHRGHARLLRRHRRRPEKPPDHQP